MKILISLFILVSAFTRLSAQTTIILQPGPEGKDSYINDYYTITFENYPNLFAAAGTHEGIPFINRSLFQFDLSVIPLNATVLEAKLSLYFANNPSNPYTHYGDNASWLQRIVEPWDEATVTWWNQPATTSVNQVLLPASQFPTQDYPDIDVKPLVADMVADPSASHGFLIRLRTEEMYRRLFFASGDYAEDITRRPKLEITYMACEAPAVSFNYAIQDQTVYFEAVCSSAESWFWDFGDGYLSTLQTPEHTYELQGSYYVCLHVEDSCGAADYCDTVDVCDRPVAGFSYHSEELTVYFSDTSHFADGCFWDFGDDYYSGQPSPWHTYDSSGYYYVCLRTWNDCGEDSICRVIFVDFSAVDDLDEISVSVHPNPATGNIIITSGLKDQALLEIYNLNGQGMFKSAVDFSGVDSYPVDLSRFKPGIYILKLTNPRFTLTERIIILQ